MFASQYVVASFDDVLRALENPVLPGSLLRMKGAMRQNSSAVASVEIEWLDGSTPAVWRAAELRIIRLQSGTPPLTELLLVLPSSEGARDARVLLERMGSRVEDMFRRPRDQSQVHAGRA